MIGRLLAIRGRARSWSLAVLLIYVCALAVMTFGHGCSFGISGTQGTVCASASTADEGLSKAHLESSPAEHECLACSLQRQTTATPIPQQSFEVTGPLRITTAPLPEFALLSGVPLSHPSRGPPAS